MDRPDEERLPERAVGTDDRGEARFRNRPGGVLRVPATHHPDAHDADADTLAGHPIADAMNDLLLAASSFGCRSDPGAMRMSCSTMSQPSNLASRRLRSKSAMSTAPNPTGAKTSSPTAAVKSSFCASPRS